MPKVFVSHATADRAFVEREIISLLAGHGISVWYSRYDIRAGDTWPSSIRENLNACEWFLLVMSSRSARSEWVKDEVLWAIEHRPEHIIPVLIEDVDVRDFVMRMARIQYIDFRSDVREAQKKLLARLQGAGAPAPPVQVDAPEARPRPVRPQAPPQPPRCALPFLEFVLRSVLRAAGAGTVGGHTLPLAEVARELLKEWGRDRDEEQRRADVEAVARAPAAEVRAAAFDLVAAQAAGRSPEERQALARYLAQVPSAIRQALRRPTDISGATAPADLAVRQPEDLLPLLPVRPARFQAGDRPLAGVDWELEELLGIGGFGEVWKARSPHFASVPPVALKFCLDPPARERLVRHEAPVLEWVMRQGKHPGIVPLKHIYLSADPPCLEYDYVAGGNLAGLIRDWHRSRGPTPQQVARVVQRLADILGYAHRLNPPIVHRDLKPANVLVQLSSHGRFRLLVTDFGIGGLAASQAIAQARSGSDAEQLLVAALQGAHTLLYASPQQLGGAPPDPRDDVHALGVIWYQLLTGDLTRGRPGGRGWRKRLTDRGMPAGLVDCLEACFEEPSDRPANAAALADRLAGLLRADASPSPVTVLGPVQPPAEAEPTGEVRRLEGHASTVECVAFLPDGSRALSCGYDCTVRVWDVASGRELRCFGGFPHRVVCLVPSSDGRRAVLGSSDGSLRWWDLERGGELLRFAGHAGEVACVALSRDGGLVLSGGADAVLRLWDAATGQELRRFVTGSPEWVSAAAFSPDGRHALSGSADGLLRLWDVATGQEVRRFKGHTGHVSGAAFSPGGGLAVSGSRDNTVRLWDVAKGKEVRYLVGHAHEVSGVAFSADGRRVVSGGMDRTVRLWDVETGRELACWDGHTEGVLSVALSPDGRRALSGGDDSVVRLWGLPG